MMTITRKVNANYQPQFVEKPVDQNKAILRNIIIEITDECERRNLKLDKNFVNFTVNMMIMNPKMELNLNQPINRSMIAKFVHRVLNIFSESWSIPIIVLKMQAFFQEKFMNRCEIIERYTKLKAKSTTKMSARILEMKVDTEVGQEALLQDIAIEIIVNTDIGDPGNSSVVSDTLAAINSVMSEADKCTFLQMSKFERKAFLDDLQSIVCGILVFNRDAGVCTDAVIDLKKILEQSYESTKSMLQIVLIEIIDRVNLFSSALWAATEYNPKTGDMIYNLPRQVTKDDVFKIRDLLILNRQHEIYTRKLLDELTITKTDIDSYYKIFQDKLDTLHETLKYRTAVLMRTVFPVFVELARTWLDLRNYIFVLSDLNQINQYLTKLSDACPNVIKLAYLCLGTNNLETDEDRMRLYQNYPYLPENEHSKVIQYCAKMCLEYSGYCCWYLMKGGGILIPGNPAENGVLFHKLRNYSFAVTEAALNFLHDSSAYTKGILEMALDKIELIHFLDILNDVTKYASTYVPKTDNVNEQTNEVQLVEQEVQTELHPIPYNQDKNYMWNVWDLRRKAIQLANLRKCKTSANQTLLSYQTNQVKLQAALSKDCDMQTMTEVQTNTVQPKHVIMNVRKDSTNMFSTIAKMQDLTIQGIEITCPAIAQVDCSSKPINRTIPKPPAKSCNCSKSRPRTKPSAAL